MQAAVVYSYLLAALLLLAVTQIQAFIVGCYVTAWSRYRKQPATFLPENVDVTRCTHVTFAFANLDKSGVNIIPTDASDLNMYTRVVGLKMQKPELKVMLSIGGWTMGSEEFTALVSSSVNMMTFSENAVFFLRHYGFDGLDINWEYPADRGSPAGDKQLFTILLQTVSREFQQEVRSLEQSRLILSTTVAPAPFRVQQSYELEKIVTAVDFINLMAYDLHGSWEHTVGHHSALYPATSAAIEGSVNAVVDYVASIAGGRTKLILGIPFYGRTFLLADPRDTYIGALATGPGLMGQYSLEAGVLAYFEICKVITDYPSAVIAGRVPGTLSAPFLVDSTRWTGYDDTASVQEKVRYALHSEMGGVFAWALDMDDFSGLCGHGRYPLLSAIAEEVRAGAVG